MAKFATVDFWRIFEFHKDILKIGNFCRAFFGVSVVLRWTLTSNEMKPHLRSVQQREAWFCNVRMKVAVIFLKEATFHFSNIRNRNFLS